MKLLLFLNNDIHCASALELILPTIKSHKIKIILSQKVGNVSNLAPELVELKNHEKCDFDWREKFGFEVESFDDVNSEIALKNLREFAPDLAISIRFGQVFKQPLIDIPRLGILNLHSGILPKYRGVLATFWAILLGEKTIGMTLHYISDSAIDKGDIIGITKNEVDFNSTLFQNIQNLYPQGCALLCKTLEKIFNGEKIATTKQLELGAGQYFSYPKFEDVEKFKKLMSLKN